MNIMRKERGCHWMLDVAYRPTPCMHCDDAPCIRAAAREAVYKRADGIVIIDPERAAGQKELVKACPYGAIYWNEESGVAQKCTLCAHLLDDGWEKPRCAQSCPTGALSAVCLEDDAMAGRAEAEGLRTLTPEWGTRPRVYYRNLHLYDECFVGGSVSFKEAGLDECAAGAKVTLQRDGEVVASTVADCFGDFKFDHLAGDSGTYTVLICFRGIEAALDVNVEGESVYLGEVLLA
jgi:Fe-S-cluster-containing dehydrogenase component